jgi:hypothetical protein
MFYAMRVVMVAGVLMVASGCKTAVTQVQKQPEVAATAPTPGVPVSAPASTGPVPAKVAPPRVKVRARAPKGKVSGAIGGVTGGLFGHHKSSGMPIC